MAMLLGGIDAAGQEDQVHTDLERMDGLYEHAERVLGSEVFQALKKAPLRGEAFDHALELAIKTVGSPESVSDQQIISAMEMAHELHPEEPDAEFS